MKMTQLPKTTYDFTVLLRATAFGLVVLAGLWAVPAAAWYQDDELSSGNTFTATEFDIHLNKTELVASLGPGLTDAVDFSTSILPLGDSLDPRYTVSTELQSGDTAFCDALTLHADWGDGQYDAALTDFSSATTTYLGTWELDLELDSSASNFAHGAECNVDIVFAAWRDGVDTPQESGYTDEERISVRVTAGMVVLNEFLPRPNGEAYGFDFGDDYAEQPQGEWVELFNNSNEPADLAGWSIVDAADNTIPLTASNTAPATTTIPARGWLVVYMNTAVLNNTGDTVMLVAAADRIVDSYTYEGGDYCEREPTPEDENEASADIGECDDVPANKSWARIPDGVGDFVDPLPTPGGVNVLSGEEELTPKEFQFASERAGEVQGAATSSATSSVGTASSTASTTNAAGKSSASTSTSTAAKYGDVKDAADNAAAQEAAAEPTATSSEEKSEAGEDSKDEDESDNSKENTEPEGAENNQRKTEERKRGPEEENEPEDDGDGESDDSASDGDGQGDGSAVSEEGSEEREGSGDENASAEEDNDDENNEDEESEAKESGADNGDPESEEAAAESDE